MRALVSFASAMAMLALAMLTAEAAPAPADLNPVTVHAAPKHAPVPLVQPGVAATITIAPGAPATTHQAVVDLVVCVREAAGITLKIANVQAGRTIEGPKILVGNFSEAAAEGLVGDKMPIEGFAIKTAADRIYIVGNDSVIDTATALRSNGTTWGVYEFCERLLDVRWYWPDLRGEYVGVSIPKRAELVVPPVWLSDAPVFRKREIWPSGGPGVAPYDVGAHHQRLRSADTWPHRLRVHAPHDFASAYEKTRPEIFQLRSDGQHDFTMLCYGHPRTLETYLEQIELQSKPAAKIEPGLRIVDGNNITVSPADLAVACTCEHCRRLWNEDGGQFGTASRIVGAFVAKLGEQVKQRWPEKTVVYLPYKNYSLAPDGVVFPGNVEVQICGMPGLAQHKEPLIDQREQQTIDRWMTISGRKIQNWHYDCWPEDRTAAAYLFPHTIQAHYRANREKTLGSFINGERDHWPRQHVSLYVWMKVLWNPEFNVDAAIDEFCRRMYGPAAATMRELVRLQVDGWEKSRWPGGQFSAGGIYAQADNPLVVLAAVAGMGVQRSDDGGQSWRASLDAEASTIVGARSVPSRLYISTADGAIYRSDDAGATWASCSVGGWPASNDTRLIVAAKDAATIYVGSSDGSAWVSRDGGSSWTQFGERLAAPVAALSESFLPTGMLLALAGGALYQGDGAAPWWAIGLPGPATAALAALMGQAPVLLVAQAAGGIARSDDGGATWTIAEVEGSTGAPIDVLVPVSYHIDTAFAGDGAGQVLTSGDRGRSWQLVKQNLPAVRGIAAARLI